MNTSSFIPNYQRLVNFYKQRVLEQEYMPGDRIDSINRIMTRHSVSRETAKRVLHELNAEGYVLTISGRGSFVKTNSEINPTWAVIIPFYSSNMEQLLNCLHAEARKRKREFTYFLHYNNYEEEKRLVSSFIHEAYECIIIVPNYDESQTAEFYSKLITGKTNLFLVDNTMSCLNFNYVIQSYDLGIKRALEYLIANQKQNILFVKSEFWKGKNLLNEFIEDSLRAYASRESGNIEIHTEGNAHKIDADFCKAKNISGIICYNDMNAATIVGKLLNQGVRIPEEVSVINYGNTELTKYFTPSITAVDCKYELLAERTGKIIDRANTSKEIEQHVILPELILRET